jgi:hypothetical protein
MFRFFRFLFMRAKAQSLETSFDKILLKATKLKEKASADEANVVAALKLLGEEAKRIDALKARLGGLGI